MLLHQPPGERVGINVPAGLIGRKLGMTRVFGDDGRVVPVTVIGATPNTVTRLRSAEQDGYTAVQLGAGTARRVTKPVAGQFKELPKEQQRPAAVREFRIGADEAYEVGQQLDVSLFEAGDLVDVVGVSKGHGFTGTIARHNFKRGPKTHGSDNYRKPGSVGAGTTPGRVFKNTKMAGHMGDARVTVKKLKVVRVDPERNLLLVRGAVPGARNGLLLVQKAK
jgi:large subunit ribosomal protein L3